MMMVPAPIHSQIMHATFFCAHMIILNADTVQPRLSGPSIFRTSWRPENTLPRMRRRRGQ